MTQMAPAGMKVPMDLALSKQVRNYYELVPQAPRSYGYHPSSVSLDSFCPVWHYYLEEAHDQIASTDPAQIAKGWELKKAMLESKKIKGMGKLQQEFHIGTSIHNMIQYSLGVVGKLRGRWQCGHLGCGVVTRTADFMPRTTRPDHSGNDLLVPAPCPNCRGGNLAAQYPWIYVEPGIGWTALARQLGMQGHMDGDLWDYRDGHWFRYVLEIKSINEWGWSEGKNPHWSDLAKAEGWTPPPGWRDPIPHDDRKLPLAKHVTQATLYAASQGITHIYFIYVNKNQVSQWKEQAIPIDAAALDAAYHRIESIEGSRRNVTGPPLHARICSDIRDETAVSCPVAERCFGCKRPEGGFTW